MGNDHEMKRLPHESEGSLLSGLSCATSLITTIWYERPFTPDDLAAIEKRMRELIDKDYDVVKKMTPRAEVIDVFKKRGEDYKLRLIEDMPDEKQMGLYYHEEYVDMCRGACRTRVASRHSS